MNVAITRPIVIDPYGTAHPCATCDARQASICNAIPDADLARLASASVGGIAKSGTTFINEGDPASAFFNVTSGIAKLYKLLPDGRRQITRFVGVGHFLGLAVSDTYSFSAEAIDTVRYCRFSRARLREILDDFPLMEQCLLKVASSELVAAQEQMLLLGRKTARERVASFLLTQSRLGSACQNPSMRFELKMTRADIGDYLGLTVETISRNMTKLRTVGAIDVADNTTIVIRDRPALEGLADGTRQGP